MVDVNASRQAENFKKILLTLTDDPRVILIKLADRHHIVEKGRVVWSGSSDALAGDSNLQHRYLGV